MSQEPQLIIPLPPKRAYAYDPTAVTQENIDKANILTTSIAQNESIKIIEKIVGAGMEYRWDVQTQEYIEIEEADYAPKSGWYVYHKGTKFPQPCFPNPYFLRACEQPKKYLINWLKGIMSKEFIPLLGVFMLLPRKIKGKIIDVFLQRYCDYADIYLMPHYLRPQFYHHTCTEIRGFIIVFLVEMGVSLNTANRFAYAFTTLIEGDSAYRVRVIDLFSETTLEKMLKNPTGEIKKLIKILEQRDERVHLVKKFNLFARLLRYGFFFIRGPFITALKSIDFPKLQYDEIDRNFVKHWITYDFFGKTIDERLEMYPREGGMEIKLKYANG